MSVYYNAAARYGKHCPVNERVREVKPPDRGPASTQPIQMLGETCFVTIAPAHQQKTAQIIPKERLSARLKLTIVQELVVHTGQLSKASRPDSDTIER